MAKRGRTVLSPVKPTVQMVRRTSESNTAARDALTQVVCRPPQVRNPAAGARRSVCFVSCRTVA